MTMTEESAKPGPKPRHVVVRPDYQVARGGRLQRPGQDAIRRVAAALKKSGSRDIFVLATVAIEALIEGDLNALLGNAPAAPAAEEAAPLPAPLEA